ncbi:hypothetical protein NFI96_030643 [Prochilodus magdalenae]|nr:hypothetical protein NFI96_030643 [Prochilodus magdalenae]
METCLLILFGGGNSLDQYYLPKYPILLFLTEFVSVLADKQVKEGGDVTLCCKANTGRVTAKWKKNDQSLQCVADRHRIYRRGTEFTLEIRKAEKEDEGKYTVTLQNESGSASCSAMVTVGKTQRMEDSGVEYRLLVFFFPPSPEPMITALQNFTIDEVTELRFLLHGPAGAGKSSIINTVETIFEGHQFINCLAASELTDQSFTKQYEKFPVGTLPFAFYNMMGLEDDWEQGNTVVPSVYLLALCALCVFLLFLNKTISVLSKAGKLAGVHQNDIIKALKGHIPDDYEFQTEASMSVDNRYYISNPTLNDQIHCLISVIAADKVTLMNDGVIQKMKTIRAEASNLGIPQLVFMTRVDQACLMTQKDLTKIYQSKKIKEKMKQCSVRLGIPMNCIFPVKNYHEETKANNNLNCLMLEGLTQAVYSAHEYVKNHSSRKQ